MSVKKVRCPHCKNWTDWTDNPFRPFCSKHCRTIDLGNWASESYRIASDNQDEEEDGAPPAGIAKQEED